MARAKLQVFRSGELRAETVELRPDRATVLGRVGNSDIIIAEEGVSMRHCEVVPGPDGYTLHDLDSNAGVRLNGKSVAEAPLTHGDAFIVGTTTTVVFVSQSEVHEPQLEQAIADEPADDDRWKVYGDYLVENGDPAGERIGLAASGRWHHYSGALEGLSYAAAQGELEVSWRFGFLREAKVRGPASVAVWQTLVGRLLSLRAAQFLESLTIDVPALTIGFRSRAIDRFVDAILDAGLPHSLRRLSLGVRAAHADEPEHATLTLPRSPAQRKRLPLLTAVEIAAARVAQLVPLTVPAGMTLRGASLGRPIALGQSSLQLSSRQTSLRLSVGAGNAQTSPVVSWVNERWAAMPANGTRVNGFPLRTARALLPGDVVETGDGLTLRFQL